MITNPTIQSYIEQNASPQQDLLNELEKETYQKTVLPQMISGRYQGRILSMFSKLIRPKNILEVGTFTGFSTLCLAEGLATDGTIHTIDKNDEFQPLQQKYFERSPYHKQIKTYLGNALEWIPQLNFKFDLAFIDADKKNYPAYFEMILPKMNQGGLILADNVLWYGKVTNPDAKDAESLALKQYNETQAKDPRVEVFILPVRDGISVARVR